MTAGKAARAAKNAEAGQKSWGEAIAVYKQRPVITMLFLGFSAGLPILLVFGTLSIWLREAGIERATIGFFSWVALSYGFKFLWAPLIDRVPLPILSRALGRRRGWLLFAQIAVAFCILMMAFTDASVDPVQMAIFAALLAFCGATQDIVIDAYRIEAAETDVQAAMTSTYQLGYRLAMILAGAGALEIAGILDVVDGYSYEAWRGTYMIMAACMVVGVITTFLAHEPVPKHPIPKFFETGVNGPEIRSWLYQTIVAPFLDFFQRYGTIALTILALISLYRLTDVVMGVMAGPFYIDMGFEKQEIGRISKFFGIWMTIAGAFLGGILALRFGTLRVLLLGGILAAITNLIFAFMATQDKSVTLLVMAIIADNLSAGLAGTVFIAFLSSLTNTAYTATQYALFSSIMLLFPKFVAGFSGVVVDAFGYVSFFSLTALLGLPAILLILYIMRIDLPTAEQDAAEDGEIEGVQEARP